MTKRIIYKEADGRVSILFPVLSCGLTVEEIAAAHVPAGCVSMIIDTAALPSSLEHLEAWTFDENKLTVKVDPVKLKALLSKRARQERDFILEHTVDPIISNQLRWAGMTSTEQAAWSNYRKELLDIPQQTGFPSSIIWPTQP